MLAAVALGVATAAAVIAQALLLARIVAGVFIDGDSPAEIRGPLVALALVSIARGLLAWGYEVAGHVGAVRVMSALRGGLVAHVLRNRPVSIEAETSGEIATAAVQGSDSASGPTISGAP